MALYRIARKESDLLDVAVAVSGKVVKIVKKRDEIFVETSSDLTAAEEASVMAAIAAQRSTMDKGEAEVQAPEKGVIVVAPDGRRWRIIVDASGVLSTEAI